MFERSLNGHTWQDYLHAVMELKHAPEHAAKGSALCGPFPWSHVPITAIQSWSQNIPVPAAEAFPPQQQMLVGPVPTDSKTQMLMSMVGLLEK